MHWRRPRWMYSTTVVDLVVAGVVAFPTLMDAWWNEEGSRQADWLTYAAGVVSIVALLFRRRWPFPVALVTGGALTCWYVLGHHGEMLNLPAMVALYTIASQGDRRTTLIVGAVASTWSGILGFTSSDPLGARGGSPVLEMIWPLVPLALGEAARTRRELLTEHAARAAAAEADREREARRRVEAERVRIARELHDIVAHTMAAVNVQMNVAVAAFDANPEAARTALEQARQSSKEALGELRASVTLLRDDGESELRAPAPRLAQLDELAEPARAAGIDVSIDIHDLDRLPAAVEMATYRVVQEALTNVVRHSDAHHVVVTLVRDAVSLVLEVVDDGTVAAARQSAADRSTSPADGRRGYGLIGMAERAAALGGELSHGAGEDGGFRVRATFPCRNGER